MGIGSICVVRSPSVASSIIEMYGDLIPGAEYHAFGVHLNAITPEVRGLIRSWDSYCWSYMIGFANARDEAARRGEGETISDVAMRMARRYLGKVRRKQEVLVQERLGFMIERKRVLRSVLGTGLE